MYGAVYGDLIGSLYEYKEYLEHDVKRMIEASEKEKLLTDECFISDDTILTVAIRDAFVNRTPYDATLKKYILENSEALNREDYFKYIFSPNIIKCARGNMCGNSAGNGAIMRISSVGELSTSYMFMVNEVLNATRATHNNQTAIRAALCISMIIFLAKNGVEKEEIKRAVDHHFKYQYDFDIDELRKNMFFNTTCEDTMPLVLYVFFNTDSFDEAMRMMLSLGGDTDTNCAILGGCVEALYGMDDDLKKKVDIYLPESYQKILKMNGKMM